jgi:hypothetical protein
VTTKNDRAKREACADSVYGDFEALMLSTAFGYGRPARLAARFAFAFCRRESGLVSPFGRGRFQIGFRVRLFTLRAISAALPYLSSQPRVREFALRS